MSFDALDISASGLKLERIRMAVIASNLANVNTTRNADGSGPYKKKEVVAQSTPVSFQSELQAQLQAVEVQEIVEDAAPPKVVYDPTHPDANGQGYVNMPNISAVEEMVNLLSASRAYRANLNVMSAAKANGDKTLQILN